MTSQLLQKSETIGGYLLVERLGAGGYGEVWKVEAPGGFAKAMKLVYGRFDESRATRELKALNLIKEVRHPFLCNIERFEIIDGQLIMVTELADMSLKDHYEACRREKQPGISREELLGFLQDAADALDYMGQRHALQHLDVKPENLLLLSGHVKVADFGLVKGLQADVTMSLVGGLTPMYAAPEVFDDQPTQHSDQYSLAIVYQEMLTGALPFPGRTPAQLAAQHLSGRPRLETLPKADREVISHALSKDPQGRFESCSELINALRDVGKYPSRSSSEDNRSLPLSDADTTSKASSKTNVVEGLSQASDDGAASALKTEALSDEQREAVKRSTANSRIRLRRSSAEAKCDDLGPLDTDGIEASLQPTLILGVGGVAGRVLRDLHGSLSNRFGDLAKVPAIAMVLIDTDARSLDQSNQETNTATIPIESLCATPLRRTQDYRESSRDILRWMSRRWLYNIPRSLETEGIRPLGRLALADHAPHLVEKIQRAIETCGSEAAINESLETTGLPLSGEPLRVIVVASISGGTGSGMVIDLGYMTRQILARVGHHEHSICALLTHSTSSNPSQQDLATANAFACLSELHQYNTTGGGYPGDQACGLAAVDSRVRTFDDTYFVRLGDELSEGALNAATQKLACYLQLEVASAWGPLIQQCRREDRTADAVFGEPVVRAFDLSQIGCDLQQAARQEIQTLCQQVVRRWCETPRESLKNPSKDCPGPECSDDERQPRAARWVEEIGLDGDSLLKTMIEHARKSLELEDSTGFEVVVGKLAVARGDAQTDNLIELTPSQLIQSVDEIVSSEVGEKQQARGMVRRRLQQAGAQLARRLDEAIHDFIMGLANSPGDRLLAALTSTDWFRENLWQLAKELKTQADELAGNLNEMATTISDPKSNEKRSWWGMGTRQGEGDAASRLRQHFVNDRVRHAAIEETIALVERLSQQLGSLNDRLLHAGVSLKPLLRYFGSIEDAAPTIEEEFDDESQQPSFETTILEAFHNSLSDLAPALDEKFDREVLQSDGGLLAVCEHEGQIADLVVNRLETAALTLILGAMREIDVAQLFLDSCGDQEKAAQEIRECATAANASNLKCGGTRRMFAAIPASLGSEKLATLIEKSMEPVPTVIRATEHDVVVGCEQASMPLIAVAARLVEDRPDLISLAQRIHTRVDIQWNRILEDDASESVSSRG